MCINIRLYDAIARHGRGVTLAEACALLPAIDPTSVVSAAHRLSSSGALKMSRDRKTILYCGVAGATVTDKRGRPRGSTMAARRAGRCSSINPTI
jgi:hypothetical protein